ncbi:hypothetical protein RSAG8_10759, partial [Rhizoctonia solani AG-8 WAC10335]
MPTSASPSKRHFELSAQQTRSRAHVRQSIPSSPPAIPSGEASFSRFLSSLKKPESTSGHTGQTTGYKDDTGGAKRL